MKAKSLGFDEVSDLRAVRLLVEDVAACYAALGVVHARWRHVPGWTSSTSRSSAGSSTSWTGSRT